MTPARKGTLVALASAVAFGITTPLVQRLGRDAGPFAVAALLYAGASVAGFASRTPGEARVPRSAWPRLFVVAVLGAGVAPVLLAWGLLRTSGIAASLMLNLEALFTLALARLLYREHLGRRVLVAALFLAIGGGLLVVDRGGEGRSSVIGLVAMGCAALAWATDSAVAKPLSALDPSRIVAMKGAIGASLSAAIAVATGARLPALASSSALMLVGAVGYGFSLRLYLLAQRDLGAARTASVFAAAPFCGAALALAFGERVGGLAWLGAVAMVGGVALHMTERHGHRHLHDEVEHEHAHRHDDGHHTHGHDPMPEGEHAHPHRHDRVEHDHPHLPDLHHVHRHEADDA